MIIRDFKKEFGEAIRTQDVETMMSMIRTKQVEIELRTRLAKILDDDGRNLEVSQLVDASNTIIDIVNNVYGILEGKMDQRKLF